MSKYMDKSKLLKNMANFVFNFDHLILLNFFNMEKLFCNSVFPFASSCQCNELVLCFMHMKCRVIYIYI